MITTHIFSSAIGKIGKEHMTQANGGKLIGNSSQGMFILTNRERVIFITSGPYRGPQTVNLPRLEPGLSSITLGTNVHFLPEKILFENQGYEIILSNADIWDPIQRLSLNYLDNTAIFARIKDTTAHLFERRDPGPITTYLSHLVKFQQPHASSQDLAPIDPTSLTMSIRTDNEEEIIRHLTTCIGYGPGLTPSGDDFIAGILLCMSRWGDLLCPKLSPIRIGKPLAKIASMKTTRLSTNIIENSIAGQADERLIRALDGIITGEPDPKISPKISADLLLAWGNSSGGDVLTGFAILIAGKISVPT